MDKIRDFIKEFGWARLIIAAFLVLLFAVAPIFGIRLDTSMGDVLTRFGMNAILVLSMIPMIQSGCGLNFGLPVGLIAGILGGVISLELNLVGIAGILTAMVIGIFFATIFGFLYGELLNKIKGDEMIIATYVGFSAVFFMNMMWILLPFRNPSSVQGFKGEGLRTTISVEEYWFRAISNFGQIKINNYITIPTGMLLAFTFMALLVYFFFRTKLGTAITAVGSNPDYARAAGISINKMRTISVILSTVIGAIGINMYQQSFGFIQLYNAPLAFAFPSVAAILLGGASVNKASIMNVIIGTILFQGMLTMTPSVINNAINIDVSEVIRVVISNGMIVYALTRKVKK
ncbi:MAG: ABC transporter permease [Clostridiaceae bacterium]